MFEPSYDDDYLEDDDSDYDYEHDLSYKISSAQLLELYRYCVQPTVVDAYTNLLILFSSCAIFKLVTGAIRQPDTAHQLSSVIGCYMLFTYFKWDCLHILGLVVMGYIIILVLSNVELVRGFKTCCLMIVYLVGCEMFLVNQETWQKVRGPQMIAAMKIISIAYDLDWKAVRTIDIFEYLGYLLDLGTCVWGPWVPFIEYRNKQDSLDSGWKWAFEALITMILSLIYFTVSMCWAEYLIPGVWGGWWVVYRSALVFRVSHYFVCAVSETTMVLSGYKSKAVSRVLEIEIPRSLVSVVINWNIPMHRWLKTYVFRTSLERWGGFAAVMSTYMVSSLLHGLNPALAAVLLSLGLYTYVEHSLRNKLASRFSSCVRSRACPSFCPTHRYKSSNLIVNSTNIIFGLLSMFHLAYLGVLMDFSDPDFTLDPWRDLNFVSHWVVIGTFIFYIFI